MYYAHVLLEEGRFSMEIQKYIVENRLDYSLVISLLKVKSANFQLSFSFT